MPAPMKLLLGPSPACFDYANEPPWIEFVGVEERRIIDATNKSHGIAVLLWSIPVWVEPVALKTNSVDTTQVVCTGAKVF